MIKVSAKSVIIREIRGRKIKSHGLAQIDTDYLSTNGHEIYAK